jgi:hypothetical protein
MDIINAILFIEFREIDIEMAFNNKEIKWDLKNCF